MQLAVVGNGLQSYVVAALFASVGNKVVLFDNGGFYNTAKKEPGLARLYKEQRDSGRLVFLNELDTAEINYDFILLADTSTEQTYAKYLQDIIYAIKNGTSVIILKPAEIGETIEFSQRLQKIESSVRVCSIPVLIREGRALDDFSRPEYIIVGCDDVEVLPRVKNLFYPFNRNKNVIKEVTSKEAEFTSFASSAMLATRLSFMNEMASLAERIQVDIDVVRECIGSDPRIGHDYLYPGCGYGGRALEANVKNITQKLQLRNDDLGLLSIVTKINERQKDLLFRKIWKYFKSEIQGKTVAIWGASFKPGSTSVNGSPAVKLIESLLAQSVNIQIYDPIATESLKAHFKDYFDNGSNRIKVADSSYDVLENADVLAICTEWKEFWSPDLIRIKNTLSEPVIFDGRNILDPELMKNNGIKYYGVGRGQQI